MTLSLKCRFCGERFRNWQKDGKTHLMWNQLLSHVVDEHPDEFEKISRFAEEEADD